MMKLNLVFDLYGDLCGVFEPDCGEWVSGREDIQSQLTDVIDSGIAHCCHEDFEYWELYKIDFSDASSIWIRAQNFGAALVEAVLFAQRQKNGSDIIKAQMYDVWQDDYNVYKHIDVDEYKIFQPARNILKCVNSDNKDLCALMLRELDGIESEDKLKIREAQSLPYPVNMETAEADDIRRAFEFWDSWWILEGLDLTFTQMLFFGRCKKIKDKERALFWSYLVALWGQLECVLQYELYKRIIAGSFDALLAEYGRLRRVFVGEVSREEWEKSSEKYEVE